MSFKLILIELFINYAGSIKYFNTTLLEQEEGDTSFVFFILKL